LQEVFNHNDLPDSFKFPFKKGCVEIIHIRMVKASDDRFICFGSVHFENGKTSGKQQFDGNGLKDLLLQIETFVNGIDS
jgi:hypothetical protein